MIFLEQLIARFVCSSLRARARQLEREHADEIARVMRSVQAWWDAKLPQRALSELEEIEKFMTTTSEQGAAFHMQLAKVALACDQPQRAKRLWTRVATDAKSSSQRWQAQRLLDQGTSTGSSSSSSGATKETSNLFRMPTNWD